MDSNEYQILAGRTLIDGPEQPLNLSEIKMLFIALRAQVLLGRFIEKLKKNVLHRHELYTWANFCADCDQVEQDISKALCLGNVDGLPPLPQDPQQLTDLPTMVLWNVVGLAGESTEVSEALLKHFAVMTDFDSLGQEFQEVMTKELGDVAWYHAAIATKLGLKISGIQQANIEHRKKHLERITQMSSEDLRSNADAGDKDSPSD